MPCADNTPNRGRCWHCGSKDLRELPDGWICLACTQHGPRPVCEAADCIITWKGTMHGDCRAPSQQNCLMNLVDEELGR